jgi:transposase
MELSNKKWKLAMGDGARRREQTVEARDERRLFLEVARAKAKLGMAEDAPVVFGFEAGRDGFWIARMIQKHGHKVYVMDPASIEVPRRARQRKTDRLDAARLLDLLVRYEQWGQHRAFSAVRVPSQSHEAALRLHRERQRLVNERRQHQARIKSLLALHGIVVKSASRACVEQLKDWEGKGLSVEWVEELRREQQRLAMVEKQLSELEAAQQAALNQPRSPAEQKARKLQRLKAVGQQTSWLLSHEAFGWRHFANRRQVGAFAGLTGTPFDSGETLREQGISKAGSRRVRTTMIELAWLWVRWQPNSALTKWFVDRYVRHGSKVAKRKGIVALARKLLIALWKYVEQDVIPEGALLSA